ncbi:hypothetical protein DRJ17_04650 [Candidatus Woesearchaeota archaeon]|nr:MAG: hypothetical protein DRJ17_04650 [Candidatus Woesearchaeota archaeon]
MNIIIADLMKLASDIRSEIGKAVEQNRGTAAKLVRSLADKLEGERKAVINTTKDDVEATLAENVVEKEVE